MLELVLSRLAEFQEKAQKVKNKVAAAMIYPAIVLVLAFSIMSFLLVFIVPKFQQIFHDMLGDKPLPAITEFVIGVSNAFKDHWLILLGALVALVAGYRFSLAHHPRARRDRQPEIARPAFRRSQPQERRSRVSRER